MVLIHLIPFILDFFFFFLLDFFNYLPDSAISSFFIFVSPVLLNSVVSLFCIIVSLFPSRALADTRQIGKLTREQFALAMHLIQQKVSKGIDPPQTLTADMIPPSERGTPIPVGPTHTNGTSLLELIEISVYVLGVHHMYFFQLIPIITFFSLC